MTTTLRITDLEVEYRTQSQTTRALDGVSLGVETGEVVGVVGESGSGKSTLGLAIGRLLPGTAFRVGGDLLVGDQSVFSVNDEQMRSLRRDYLGFVFQNPMSSLDPTMHVEAQLADTLETRSTAAVDQLLRRVGLSDLSRIRRSYPHQLSGGMAQRVAIAVAIAREPKLVVADEPTASLDASVRGQIMELLAELPRLLSGSVLILSHDLTLVAGYCSRVAVMYAGRAVEVGESTLVFKAPNHPYTSALLAAAPGSEGPDGKIAPIRGMHPVLQSRSDSCPFAPRCEWAIAECTSVRPEARPVGGQIVICHRAEEVAASPSHRTLGAT